jgi:hypothetical protein
MKRSDSKRDKAAMLPAYQERRNAAGVFKLRGELSTILIKLRR